MTDKSLGICFKDFAVPNLHMDRFAAIKTWSVDTDCLAGEQPADCQRFESSLAEPFLPAVNGDPVLVGQIVKGCHRDDKVCFRI